MTIDAQRKHIQVQGLEVEIVRKAIKHLHLGVYPPQGRVRVAAPPGVSDDAVRLAVISRLGWIRRHRAKFEGQPRQTEREMVSGESHYFLGRSHRLRVVFRDAPACVVLRNRATLELQVRPAWRAPQFALQRQQVLARWYRQQLRSRVGPLVEKWQAALNVSVSDWGIKRMKTRWGSCNAQAKRIWLNLELIKKPPQCLEYVVVHEMLHLIERHHNERFVALLDAHLPGWRAHRDELNSSPLGHETWTY